MPESRNRPGHHFQKKADIPARQRVTGRVVWAILFAIFGLLIAFFSSGDNYIILAVVAALSALLGYRVGKNMERDATHKS